MEPIRILVVDDHPIVVEGLIAVLETQPDFQVVGQATSGAQALVLAQTLQPDIVLLDLEMPGMDGIETLRQLSRDAPQCNAIMFTAHISSARTLDAVEAGARGYVLKDAPRQEVFRAVRVVHMGGSLLHPQATSHLIARVQQPPSHPEPDRVVLTPREQEVLDLVARGLQNKEIAQVLSIAQRTVKFHVSSLLVKLDATNRTEAVSVAISKDLITISK